MSEAPLDARMRASKFEITDSVSRVNATIDMWADEVASLQVESVALKAQANGLAELAEDRKRTIASLQAEVERLTNRLGVMTEQRDRWGDTSDMWMVRYENAEKRAASLQAEVERLRGWRHIVYTNVARKCGIELAVELDRLLSKEGEP